MAETEKAEKAEKRPKRRSGRRDPGVQRSGMPPARPDEETVAEVKTALEKAGYEFPRFGSREEQREFVEDYGYDPQIVLNSTLQMRLLFRDWKKRIQPLAQDAEEN